MNTILLFTLLILAIGLISFFLTYFSMRNYRETSHSVTKYTFGLYLIRNLNLLNKSTLDQIYKQVVEMDAFVSFERLFKGSETAFTIFAPDTFPSLFPELELLELEDYIKGNEEAEPHQQLINQAYAWEMEPRKNQELIITDSFLDNLSLSDDQQLFWQLVSYPVKSQENTFQVSVRGVVTEHDHNGRITLSKTIIERIKSATGLATKANQVSSGVFEAFEKRMLVPKEVSNFTLSSTELLDLLGK